MSLSKGFPKASKPNSASRTRWRDSSCSSDHIADLVAKLETHAHKKSFLQYTTAGSKVADGKLDPAALIAKKHILASLRELSADGGSMPCFTSKQVKAALEKLSAKKKDIKGWHIKEADFGLWLKTNDIRLRTMCRQLAQAELNPPTWLKCMPWKTLPAAEEEHPPKKKARLAECSSNDRVNPTEEDEDSEDEEGGESEIPLFEKGPQEETQCEEEDDDDHYAEESAYLFGYSSTAKAAWRVLKIDKKGRKEYMTKFWWPENAADTSFAFAMWNDNMKREITEVTVELAKKIEALKGQTSTTASRQAANYEHQVKKTMIKIFAAPQKGRSFLIILTESGRQKLCVMTKLFCEPGQNDDDPAVVDEAFRFLDELAQDYAADRIVEDRLKATKNERLKDRRKKSNKPGAKAKAMRRPASARSVRLRPLLKKPSIAPPSIEGQTEEPSSMIAPAPIDRNEEPNAEPAAHEESGDGDDCDGESYDSLLDGATMLEEAEQCCSQLASSGT